MKVCLDILFTQSEFNPIESFGGYLGQTDGIGI